MQGLGAVTPAQLRAAGQEPLMRVEIYAGGAWIDLDVDLAGEKYVEGADVSLGGASMTPNPVEGNWGASLFNLESVFHPHHPTSAYTDYLRTERLVRISIGATYDDVDYYWPRIIGYMDEPKFSSPDYRVALSGGDYMKRLRETELRMPNNYWGDHEHFTSIASDGLVGAEIYAEVDAMDTADDGTAPYDNVANWAATECTFISFADAGSPSTFFVGRLTAITPLTFAYVKNLNVGNAVVGTEYKIRFNYRGVGEDGSNSIQVRIYQVSGLVKMQHYHPTDDWIDDSITFTALDTNIIEMWVVCTPSITDLRLDDFSISEFTPYWKQHYPIADANSKGPYFVTIDGDPVWQGEVDEGWYYTEDAEAGPDPPAHPARIVYFDPNKTVTGGDDLIVYYFLQQEAEDVVADLLYFAGVIDPATGIPYADEAAALATLIAHAKYVDPNVQIDKVWFEPGSACLDAIKKVCEICDYRFYFDYGGAPVFRPKPTWGGADFTFTDPSQIDSISTYQDRNEIKNRVVIKGDKRAEPVSREDTMPSYWEGEASDAVSIANYGERTLTINNHLFQSQAVIDARRTSLIAEYKDPKWYSTLKISFNAVPLELGDSLQWEERLSPTLNITRTGIIRDIKIDNFNTTYKCEIVPIFLDDFKDAVRNPSWTDIPNNGLITEANGVLTFSVAGGVDGDWWQPNIDNAPIATISPSPSAVIVITKLNSYAVNDLTNAGLIIGNTLSIPDAAGTYCYSFMRAKTVATPINGLEVINLGVLGSQAANAVTTLPIWLRIRATAKSAPNTIYFDYSLNGMDWTNLHSIADFTWSFVGLHAKNWGLPLAAISAPFEFFRIDVF